MYSNLGVNIQVHAHNATLSPIHKINMEVMKDNTDMCSTKFYEQQPHKAFVKTKTDAIT